MDNLDYVIQFASKMLSVNKIKFYAGNLISGCYKGKDDEINYLLKAAINWHTWEYTYFQQTIRSAKFGFKLAGDCFTKHWRQWHSYRIYKPMRCAHTKYPSVYMQISENVCSAIVSVIFCRFSPFQNRRAGAQCNINCSASSQHRHCRRCAIAP